MEQERLTELIIAAREGNQQAFSALVAAYNRPVAQVVMAEFVCSADDLQDALQVIWAAAWRSLPGLRQPEKFGGWLQALARKRAITLRNRQHRHERRRVTLSPFAEDDPTGRDPLEEVAAPLSTDPAQAAVGRDLLRAALNQLSPNERTAFSLRIVARPPWEFEAIGWVMGTGPIGARVAYSRACARLRAWWEEEARQ